MCANFDIEIISFFKKKRNVSYLHDIYYQFMENKPNSAAHSFLG